MEKYRLNYKRIWANTIRFKASFVKETFNTAKNELQKIKQQLNCKIKINGKEYYFSKKPQSTPSLKINDKYGYLSKDGKSKIIVEDKKNNKLYLQDVCWVNLLTNKKILHYYDYKSATTPHGDQFYLVHCSDIFGIYEPSLTIKLDIWSWGKKDALETEFWIYNLDDDKPTVRWNRRIGYCGGGDYTGSVHQTITLSKSELEKLGGKNSNLIIIAATAINIGRGDVDAETEIYVTSR